MSEFKSHRVVPDLLSTWPSHTVSVQYHHGHEAQLGNILSVSQTQSMPKIHFESEPGKYYTIICCDPDAPSREKPDFRNWLHWLTVNVPGTGAAHIDAHHGHTIAQYMGPAPPPGTGLHRYCFVVYKQEKLLDVVELGLEHNFDKVEDRKCWSLENFIKNIPNAQLYAGNFFQAQHE